MQNLFTSNTGNSLAINLCEAHIELGNIHDKRSVDCATDRRHIAGAATNKWHNILRTFQARRVDDPFFNRLCNLRLHGVVGYERMAYRSRTYG